MKPWISNNLHKVQCVVVHSHKEDWLCLHSPKNPRSSRLRYSVAEDVFGHSFSWMDQETVQFHFERVRRTLFGHKASILLSIDPRHKEYQRRRRSLSNGKARNGRKDQTFPSSVFSCPFKKQTSFPKKQPKNTIANEELLNFSVFVSLNHNHPLHWLGCNSGVRLFRVESAYPGTSSWVGLRGGSGQGR